MGFMTRGAFLLTKHVGFMTRGSFVFTKHMGFLTCGAFLLTKHIVFVYLWCVVASNTWVLLFLVRFVHRHEGFKILIR